MIGLRLRDGFLGCPSRFIIPYLLVVGALHIVLDDDDDENY